MTTLNEAREAIYSRFVDNYTGVASSRITFDNEEFEAPTTGNWVRLMIVSTSRTQTTLGRSGNRRFLSTGIVLVQVYTRVNTGLQDSDSLTREVAELFEGVSFSGVDFNSAFSREIGPQGPWYMAVVEAEFSFEEIK